MRAIVRALDELIGVLAASFVMLGYIAGGLIWFTCGATCFCFVLVALFSMIMWLLTGDTHAFYLMLGYVLYAAAAYAGVAAISYYRTRPIEDLVANEYGSAAEKARPAPAGREDAPADPVATKWSAQ